MPTSVSLKLSDTQLVILSRAAQCPGGRIALPDHLRGGAADRVIQSLLKHDLLVEERMPMPADLGEQSSEPAYMITAHGLAAIGLGAVDAPLAEFGADDRSDPIREPGEGVSAGTAHCAAETSSAPSILPGADKRPNKQSAVLAMLRAEGGASVEAIIGATGWQGHTIRAVISGFRKRGLDVDRMRDPAGVSRYRIVNFTEAQAGDAVSSVEAE